MSQESEEAMGEKNDLTLGDVERLMTRVGARQVEMGRARYAGGTEKFACSVSLVLPSKPGLTTVHAFGNTLGDALVGALESALAAREEVGHG